MIGGIYVAGAPFAGVIRAAISAAASLAASATITVTATATISPPSRLAAEAAIVWTASGDLSVPIDTAAGIWIDGINVTGRVRYGSPTIRDVLNDAPNTATFTIEGDAPAVGQRVRILTGRVLLFAGAVQTIDQAYEATPAHLAWYISAIDDTAEANARRPFGTWFDTAATTIAQAITATFAPGFSTAGIAADLPPTTIVFDGADPFIACLARLASAVGGYCKIEDHVVYLFIEDLAAPPHPIDDTHRFLFTPPVSVNTDSSQLRTRVYGKGYGETVLSDINSGETLLPIQDGALFPPLGGTAIVGLTPDGAQSDTVGFTSVLRPVGGSLVGPGAAPANAPTLGLAAGGIVTSGLHEVAVVHVTAAGKSLAGPRGAITTGAIPAPTGALTANTATNGTGPDQGSHDYVVTNLMLGGETTPGPASNAITTSAASGQLAAPTVGPSAAAQAGAGVTDGQHDYAITFENAQGETQVGPGAWQVVTVAPVLTGQLPIPSSAPTPTAVVGAGVDAGQHFWTTTFGDANGDTTPATVGNFFTVGNGPQITAPTGSQLITAALASGGSLTVGGDYWWYVSFGDAAGETEQSNSSNNGSALRATSGQRSATLTNIALGGPGTTKRFIYRRGGSADQFPHLVATINDNTTTTVVDGVSDATAQAARVHPGGNTTGLPYHVVNLTNIPIGPAGTTNRKIWRQSGGFGPRFVGSLNDNLTTTLTDTTPNASLGAAAPTANTTGAMQPNNQISVSNIQTGPAGTTTRRLYRRFNQAGAYLFVATIGNNTATTYLDTKANGQLGAQAPTSNTTGTAVQKIPLTAIPLGPGGTTGRNIYRRYNGSGAFRLVTTLANNTSTTFTDAVQNASLGATAPASNTAIGNQIAMTQIPVGSSLVTSREIYLTLAGGGALHLALTLADNTTRDATLNVADATIAGAAGPPTADTSGLSQPQGQVNPGSTSLIVASPAPFLTTGGWMITGGGQVVRYTGISGQLLTGVPASGAGAIVTTILYGQQATPAPMLVGVTGLTRPMLKGSAVHIWIQRDDLLAQAEQAARTGGDGVVEFVLVDTRRGVASLVERCDADLALFSRPIVTVSYATRDLKTKSGKPIVIDLPSQRLQTTLTIQDVTITEIDLVAGLAPRFTVKASSVRFSLEDTLRRLIAGGQIVGGSS